MEILRQELIEFMEANNYFINDTKTKENAISIVDKYLSETIILNVL